MLKFLRFFTISTHIMISKNQIKLIRSLESKKGRRQSMLFVAEGPKVVEELLKTSSPHTIIATSEWINANPHIANATEVTADELTRASLLKTPQQVLALFPVPAAACAPALDTQKLYLALDGVQDPGNLGTIIRLAHWFGIDTIFCSPDTADAYNPKVVQATMGSIARVNVVYTDLVPLLERHSGTIPIYGTFLDGTDIYQTPITHSGIIVMGNEGNGISAPLRKLITNRLLIPSFSIGPSAESLNVAIATAITCSEFRRRQ